VVLAGEREVVLAAAAQQASARRGAARCMDRDRSRPRAAAVAARPAEASDPEPWHAPMAEGHVNGGGGQAATLEAHRPHRKTKSVSFHSATSLPTERKISSGEFIFRLYATLAGKFRTWFGSRL